MFRRIFVKCFILNKIILLINTFYILSLGMMGMMGVMGMMGMMGMLGDYRG